MIGDTGSDFDLARKELGEDGLADGEGLGLIEALRAGLSERIGGRKGEIGVG